jgi:hypothetical protein
LSFFALLVDSSSTSITSSFIFFARGITGTSDVDTSARSPGPPLGESRRCSRAPSELGSAVPGAKETLFSALGRFRALSLSSIAEGP